MKVGKFYPPSCIQLIINQTFKEIMEKTFTRVRSTKDIVISASIIICGALLTALPDSDSLNILGFVLLFTGLILIMVLKSAYKDDETGIRYCKTEHFFASDKRDILKKAITGTPKKEVLSGEDSGNSLRMDIYYSTKSGKAYIQLFEYVPYKYEPFTLMHEHDLKNVTEIIRK